MGMQLVRALAVAFCAFQVAQAMDDIIDPDSDPQPTMDLVPRPSIAQIKKRYGYDGYSRPRQIKICRECLCFQVYIFKGKWMACSLYTFKTDGVVFEKAAKLKPPSTKLQQNCNHDNWVQYH